MENTDSEITIEYSKQVTTVVLKGKAQEGKVNFYFAIKPLMESICYFNGYFTEEVSAAFAERGVRNGGTRSSELPASKHTTVPCNQHDNYVKRQRGEY